MVYLAAWPWFRRYFGLAALARFGIPIVLNEKAAGYAITRHCLLARSPV